MNHYKWKNVLKEGEFIDPVQTINETGIRLNPSFNDESFFYGSSADLITVEEYADFSMETISEEALLAAAIIVNDSALLQDGLIIFPNIEKLYGDLNG